MSEEELVSLVEQRQALKDKIDEMEAMRKALDAQIEAETGMGTHGVGRWSVYIADVEHMTFDNKAFKAEHADMYEQYQKTGTVHTVYITEVKA